MVRNSWPRGSWHSPWLSNYSLLQLLVKKRDSTLTSTHLHNVISFHHSNRFIYITSVNVNHMYFRKSQWMTWNLYYHRAACSVSVKFCFLPFLSHTSLRCHIWSQSQSHLSSGTLRRNWRNSYLTFVKENLTKVPLPLLSMDGTTNALILQTPAQWHPDTWMTPNMWTCEQQQQKQTCWQEMSQFKLVNPLTEIKYDWLWIL